MVNAEKIFFGYGGRRVYLYLHQMQQIINGISAELPDNEYRTMLEMFINDNDSKASKEAEERIKGHEQEIMRKDIE